MATSVTLFKCNLLSAGTEPLNQFQNMYMQALIMFDTGLSSGKLARDNIEPLPMGMCWARIKHFLQKGVIRLMLKITDYNA